MPDPGSRRCVARAAATLAGLATAAAVHGGETLTLHVDDDAAAGGDGLSWASPMRDLQDALAAARAATYMNGTLKRIDVLVAQGTYVPEQRPDEPLAYPFVMAFDFMIGSVVSAASLQGGFAGVGAPDPGLRDPQAFETILSGDVNGDDEPYFTNYADNTRGVVSAQAAQSTVVLFLDGLTIRGSNGAGIGAVMCHPVVRNCVIEENRNCGIYAMGGGLRVESSIVRNNEAQRGGGILSDGAFGSHPFLEVVGSLIIDNRAVYGGGIYADTFVSVETTDLVDNNAVFGGGLYVDQFSGWDPHRSIIERSRIVANSASSGGGIYVYGALTCHSVLIADNHADLGGGLYAAFDSEPTLYCSTIVSNAARRGAGLMFDEVLAPIVVAGSIIWDNRSSGDGGEVLLRSLAPSALPALRYSIVPSVELVESPAPDLTGSIDADPRFKDPNGPDGIRYWWQDNDFSLEPTSPAIDRGFDPLKEPLDHRGNPRAIDVPSAANLGDPTWPVDMGAIEFVPCPCDPDGDGGTTAFDLLLYLDWWFAGEALAERTGDEPARVDVFDLLAFLDCWFVPGSVSTCP